MDRRLVEVVDEDTRWYRRFGGSQLGELVGELILITEHVVIFDPAELTLEFSNCGAISIHLLAGARPGFIQLVDNQGGAAVNQ